MNKLLLTLALCGGVVFAQDCPSGGCKAEGTAGAQAKAPVTASAKLAKLTASAEKGCATSKTLLASLQKEFKAESPEALMKMVTACEDYAGKGCDVSKKVLAKLDTAMAKRAKQPVTLSARLAHLNKGCAKGCEKSKTLMAALVKEYKVKDAAALIAEVTAWEAEAAKGSKECTTKLATLSAKLPSKKPLSARITMMSKGCENGCEKSKAKMATLMKATGAADTKALVAQVKEWEGKADNGCAKCTTKLANLEMALAPAPVAKGTDGAKKVGLH